MTLLEQLAGLTSPTLAEWVAEHRRGALGDGSDLPEAVAKWDNRPAWDNWNKKEPPFKKKRNYFKKKD
jgi:hypothetical protein